MGQGLGFGAKGEGLTDWSLGLRFKVSGLRFKV
jgi:hypothetical protein